MSAPEEAVPAAPSLVEIQRAVRGHWERSGIIERALSANPDGPVFTFTEGPPTANGPPHVGHLFPRTLKDVHLRYRRMTGHRIVTPMAGWDCHGLPVELEIEKRLHIRSKPEIESYGVDRFCAACRDSTLEVASVWEEMSGRLGYWLDYRRPYLTMSAPYIESVWWSLKALFDRGLLTKGHYVLPYCPRCETPLSSHEVAQGYKDATDPSVTVRFPVVGDASRKRSLLVWTTTPWTLPANLLVAARDDLSYVGIRAPDGSEEILAEAALPRYHPDGAEIVGRYVGRELAGWSYRPPFDSAGPGEGRYRVVLDAMVDASEGTGFVHIAPSFGPEDQRIGARESVGVFDPLDSRAAFTEAVPEVVGRSFKAADPILVGALRDKGLLERAGTLRHTYPFCWRCGHALIYRAIASWFVRTRTFSEALVRHNATVRWVPDHLREGRFGNFLGEAKDWALSRNRYWGTPLPIWVCEAGHPTCVGSFRELAERSGSPLPDGFDPHRVTVDRIALACATCGAPARREPYTIDGWYDSGAAPFAQYHYPFEPGPFDPAVPLDFIAEGLDQTRGWFYTLLVLSTALFDRPAYRVCVVSGLALDESGQKMSKSKGNVVEPLALLDRQGGDAARWACLIGDFTEPVRVEERQIAQAARRTLGTLVHVAAFYRQNAEADRRPVHGTPAEDGPVIDRWMLSRLEGTRATVTASLEGYDPRRGALALRELVDDLSTWYLRRCRPRFWSDADPADRARADATLAHTLRSVAVLLAPFAPFTSDHLAHEVDRIDWSDPGRSVHLARWPARFGRRDEALETAMASLREEVEIGRSLRQAAEVNSRIPLPELVLVGGDPPLGQEGDRLLADELNVRTVRRAAPSDSEGLEGPDVVVRRESDGRLRATLSARPTRELLREGLVRESLRRLQALRKELGLAYLDRIEVRLWADGELYEALRPECARMSEELLAPTLRIDPGPPADPTGRRRWEIGDAVLWAEVRRSPVGPAEGTGRPARDGGPLPPATSP